MTFARSDCSGQLRVGAGQRVSFDLYLGQNAIKRQKQAKTDVGHTLWPWYIVLVLRCQLPVFDLIITWVHRPTKKAKLLQLLLLLLELSLCQSR